jgi:hypothetical protein
MLSSMQQKLIEDNHHVIYAVLKKYSLPASEYYDVCAERLCLAARSFQGNSDHFFNYAYTAVMRGLMAASHNKYPRPADIDEIPISGPDDFAEAEDKQYVADIMCQCKPYMTPMELTALCQLMAGEMPESHALNRAIEKCRAYIAGKPVEPIDNNLLLTPERRADRNAQIVKMRAHGSCCAEVAEKFGVSYKLVHNIYDKAGRPQFKTSADYARLYGIDRSTVLRHSQAHKIGHIWQIDNIKYHKPYPKYSKSYSADEISFIRNHPYWPAQEIADKIGRSANSVRIKKCRMT